MPDTSEKLELSPLRENDRVTGLSVGDAAYAILKTFFQRHAKHYEQRSLARTYVVRSSLAARPVAYVTLVCGEVFTKEDPDAIEQDGRYPYANSPAVKIARLFVDSKYRKLGIGERLVTFAIGRAKQYVCPAVGCRFIIVDAKKQSVDFYRKCGFSILKSEINKASEQPLMFIDLHKAA